MSPFSIRRSTWALLLASLALFACSRDPQWREITGDPPAGKIELSGNQLIVSPAPQASWKELVKLDIFDGFWPGITIEEAKRKFGNPLRVATNHYGTYSVYRRQGGILHVAREEHRSGKDTYRVWTLRAYPDSATSADLLHPSISKYIEPGVKRAEVIIMNSSEEPVVDIAIKQGRLDTITWIRSR